MKKYIVPIILAYIFIMSLITFILYYSDKRKARKGKWRIKESTLLLFGLFGGALGGILGMNAFRHKTKHWYFWAVNVLSLILHAALVGFAIYKII